MSPPHYADTSAEPIRLAHGSEVANTEPARLAHGSEVANCVGHQMLCLRRALEAIHLLLSSHVRHIRVASSSVIALTPSLGIALPCILLKVIGQPLERVVRPLRVEVISAPSQGLFVRATAAVLEVTFVRQQKHLEPPAKEDTKHANEHI